MRSIARAVVVGAMTLPLALGGAGLASAGGWEGKCVDHSCWSSNWKWNWTSVEYDVSVVNAGIINK